MAAKAGPPHTEESFVRLTGYGRSSIIHATSLGVASVSIQQHLSRPASGATTATVIISPEDWKHNAALRSRPSDAATSSEPIRPTSSSGKARSAAAREAGATAPVALFGVYNMGANRVYNMGTMPNRRLAGDSGGPRPMTQHGRRSSDRAGDGGGWGLPRASLMRSLSTGVEGAYPEQPRPPPPPLHPPRAPRRWAGGMTSVIPGGEVVSLAGSPELQLATESWLLKGPRGVPRGRIGAVKPTSSSLSVPLRSPATSGLTSDSLLRPSPPHPAGSDPPTAVTGMIPAGATSLPSGWSRPWEIDAQSDEPLVTWMAARAHKLRQQARARARKLQADVDFLASLAQRMKLRNKRNEAEEASRETAAALRIQVAWGGAGRAGGATGQVSKYKGVDSDAVAKFALWCHDAYPVYPTCPTLPIVVIRYVAHLAEVGGGAASLEALAPAFEAINFIHKLGEHELPAVEPTTHAAFKAAHRTKGDALARQPAERASPLAPRFVVKMIDLATTSGDEAIRRACIFTAMQYLCFGRKGINANTLLGDLEVKPDGAVCAMEREQGNGFRAPTLVPLTFPPPLPQVGRGTHHDEAQEAAKLRSSRSVHTTRGAAAAVAALTGAAAGPAHDHRVGGGGGGDDVGPSPGSSLRSAVAMLLRSQRAAGLTDKDPAFWLPAIDSRRPEVHDQAAWERTALDAALAFPPAGEKWNQYSLRSGSITAAHSVGVSVGRILAVAGAKSSARRDFEKFIDAEAQPTTSADLLFGPYRANRATLTDEQLSIVVADHR